MELAPHDKHPAPDNVTWLRNALDRAAPQPEVHRRLPLTTCPFVSPDQMGRRDRAGNQKHPHVIVDAIAFKMLAPAQIMQSVFRRKPQLAPEPVSNETVQP